MHAFKARKIFDNTPCITMFWLLRSKDTNDKTIILGLALLLIN